MPKIDLKKIALVGRASIAVIDYGMGNLRSVHKALEAVGAKAFITSDPAEIAKAGGLVLPGVGAFGAAVKILGDKSLFPVIKEQVKKGKPFLGICLGLQLLFAESEESPGAKGLGLIKGKVKAMKAPGLKIPHMGWNTVKAVGKSKLLGNLPGKDYYYFVHSYAVVPDEKEAIAGLTDYGGEFVSAVAKGNVYGVQFHPEKSQDVGLNLLKSFIKLI